MSILSKILGALFAGVLLLQLYVTIMQEPVIYFLWTAIVCLPVTLALLGRGGKVVYIVSLFISWLLAGLMIVAMPLEIYLDYFTDASGNDPKFDLVAALIICLIGLVGIGTHYCLTRLHPVASRNIIARKLNGLFLETMRRQVFAFGANVVLIVLVLEAGWLFSNVIIIYWYETVLITVFTIWTVRNQDLFDTRDPRFAVKTVEQVKDEYCKNQLMAYFFFYGIYLLVILLVAGRPKLSQLGVIAVLGFAYFLSHYFEAKENQRKLYNRPLNLKRIDEQQSWRILPMHLAIMLGVLSIGDDDPGLAIIFILLKAVNEIGQEAVAYRRRRKQAIYQRNRRPAIPDFGGIAEEAVQP